MKINIFSPSSCSRPVGVSYFCWTQKMIFWRMLLAKKLNGSPDFHSTKVLQNIIVCVQQKKENHTGLEQYEGE